MLIDSPHTKINFDKGVAYRTFLSGFAAGTSFCCFGYVAFSMAVHV